MPQTILLLVFGDLGDTILTVPAIRALRRRYPAARLILLSKTVGASYVSALGLVDQTIVVDKHLFDRTRSLLNPRLIAGLITLAWQLRRLRVDTTVLFHHLVTRWGTFKFALLTLATGAPRRVGIDNGRGWFLTSAVKDRGFGDRHEVHYWLDVAGLLDAPGDTLLEAPVSQRDRRVATDLLADLPTVKRLLAIHPGTGWYGPGRRWGARRFAEAARLVLAEEDMLCVVVGTEDERTEGDEVFAMLGHRAVNLIGKTSVGELAAILERCTVLIANDGGVSHLAAAVGTPVAAVFGPSNDRAWRPSTGTVIAVDLPCRPCFYRDFERGHPEGCGSRECLQLVTPAMAADATLSIVRSRAVAS
jgi:ADP-heptose:LPS heptosyltransferase